MFTLNLRLNSLLVLLFVHANCLAQGPTPEAANLRGDSTPLRKRLSDLEQKILTGKAAEALDDLERLQTEGNRELVSGDAKLYQSTGFYFQSFLAKLPKAVRERYRDRVDSAAAAMLTRAKDRRTVRAFQELLDRYPLSRPAEQAILALGELAMERGEFATAERAWQHLVSLGDAPAEFPDAQTDPALIHAKIVHATILQNEMPVSIERMNTFGKDYPNAVGYLAGRQGKLADRLEELFREKLPRAQTPLNPLQTAGDPMRPWQTLGGDAGRSGLVAATFNRYWPSVPEFRVPIPTDAIDRIGPKGSIYGAVRTVGFHPILVGNFAYLADPFRILKFDLVNGTLDVEFDLRTEFPRFTTPGALRLPLTVDADFTMTVCDGTLYARLGSATLFPPPTPENPIPAMPSFLYAFKIDPLDGKLTRQWRRSPPTANDTIASWDGAPSVVDGKLLATYARSEGGRIVHTMLAYADDLDRPLWTLDLCDTTATANELRTRQQLLTISGRIAVYCSHTGVVVAVNHEVGKLAWAYRYPTVIRLPMDGRYRDLCPPVAADGRVFVAPNDSDRLLAFDAQTGQILWDEGPLIFDQLLGVSQGKVIVTVAGPMRGIRAYNARTGSTGAPFGWRCHDDPDLTTFGRGFVSDSYAVWPTVGGVFFLRLEDGLPAGPPLPGPHGNLAYANRRLVVATPTDVFVYVRVDDVVPRAQPPKIIVQATPPEKPRRAFVEPQTIVGNALPTIVPSTLNLERTAGKPATLSRWLMPKPGDDSGRTSTGEPWLVKRTPTAMRMATPSDISDPAQPIDAIHTLYAGDWAWTFDPTLSAWHREEPTRAQWTLDTDRLPEPITACQCAGVTLICRIGTQHLAGIDTATGTVRWILDSVKRTGTLDTILPSAPQFNSEFVTTANRILVHLSSGHRWLIDAGRGTILRDTPTPPEPWLAPPISDPSTNRFYCADGANAIVAVDVEDGRELWRTPINPEHSLATICPHLVRSGDTLFATISRNFGTELEAFDPTNGRRLWTDLPPLLAGELGNTVSIASDTELVWIIRGNQVQALRTRSGSELWRVELPVRTLTDWQLIQRGPRLLLVPRRASMVNVSLSHSIESGLMRAWLRRPDLRRLAGLGGTLGEALGQYEAPIFLLDSQTGTIQQQDTLAVAGPEIAMFALPDGWRLAAGGEWFAFRTP